MSDQFPTYEVVLKKRGRRWIWSVWTTEGKVVMAGAEIGRSAASYKANSALFLLLRSSPFRRGASAPTENSSTRIKR